jgi:hypothetical protein
MLAIAPVGVLLGLPMPLGIARVAPLRNLVAWCWGVNGMFGVAGSAVAIYVAIHFGLSKAFLLGIACYIGAALVFWGSLDTLTRVRSGTNFSRACFDSNRSVTLTPRPTQRDA